MDENYGTWFVVVTEGDMYDPKSVEVVVYDTITAARAEKDVFGGIMLEVRTAEFACITPDEWRRNIGRRIRRMILDDPMFLKNRSVVDLRKE